MVKINKRNKSGKTKVKTIVCGTRAVPVSLMPQLRQSFRYFKRQIYKLSDEYCSHQNCEEICIGGKGKCPMRALVCALAETDRQPSMVTRTDSNGRRVMVYSPSPR